jgi:hypothetical protein
MVARIGLRRLLTLGVPFLSSGGMLAYAAPAALAVPHVSPHPNIAGGYGGHFWFTHTIPTAAGNDCTIPAHPELMITGTWTPPPSITGPVHVWASVPNVGASTSDAACKIIPGAGQQPWYHVVNQGIGKDAWIDLGVYNFTAGASVSLPNTSCNGSGDDIAWGAVAFTLQSGPYTGYVAMGDSYTSGEGVEPYYPESDTSTNKCH